VFIDLGRGCTVFVEVGSAVAGVAGVGVLFLLAWVCKVCLFLLVLLAWVCGSVDAGEESGVLKKYIYIKKKELFYYILIRCIIK
jgi:hypothetical protein